MELSAGRVNFKIHIYSFSKKVLWLRVAITNNDPAVIAGFFLQNVAKYGEYVRLLMTVTTTRCACIFLGCSRLVRADRGTENCTVAFLQPFLRRRGHDRLSGVNSFQYGKSASNQVSV